VGRGRRAAPFILARRARVQGRRARCALAAWWPSSSLERCAAACRLPVPGNPARSPEFAMAHDLVSSLDSLVSASSSSLLVRDGAGAYRPAVDEEVLAVAQRVLAGRVRGACVLDSPAVVKDFLRTRLGDRPHEIFAVVHLDSHHRVIDYVEMFRGTLTQTSVHPREVIKEALRL